MVDYKLAGCIVHWERYLQNRNWYFKYYNYVELKNPYTFFGKAKQAPTLLPTLNKHIQMPVSNRIVLDMKSN
jgi:hypothetical protein